MTHDELFILLADDDEDDRLFFKDAIEELKVRTVVNTVNDGVQLMEYLNAPDVQLPHVVFLDLNMPRKDGMECLKEIRADARLKDLSIAIYSTSSSEEDIEETFVRGANIYIKKPNDFTALKKILSEVISLNWQYHTSGLNKENFLLSL
ncbi:MULTISPECIES: response regulator [unclassified Flavobacterium]|uniref:response regulator n=1 Tax=unclassified Flavobacterium TaxID=196869 RepID=UPI001F1327F0|nr:MULTISPECIES: response regulator [unclassified Flavobacterium]UMY65148.1 response regulator [Flavobacterium sp. HJ-32-4]